MDNLENMRRFYITYSNEIKSETSSRIFETYLTDLEKLFAKFMLSLLHYLFLMRIANDKELKFYENEAT